MTRVSSSLTSNTALISKIYFPRPVLPVSMIPSALINTGVSFGIMLVLLAVYDIGFSFRLLLLPVWLLLGIMLALGIGLVLAAVAVSYRDVNYITPVFTSVLMFLSPVAYSITAVPAHLRDFYLLNPLTTIVEGMRWSLLGSTNLTTFGLVYTVVFTLGVLAVGTAIFSRLESRFADVI
jgi:lipopolysaccharide transport system permease protein